MRFSFIPLALGCLIPFAAHAADTEGKYAVRGAGAQSCENLASVIDSDDAEQKRDAILVYSSWMSGYVSSLNRVTTSAYEVMPILTESDVLAVLLTQCRRQPEMLVETVAFNIVEELAKAAALTAETPVAELDVDGKTRRFREGTLVLVNAKLAAAGFEQDEGTTVPQESALRAYQEKNDLPESGVLDLATLLRLLLS